MTDAAPSAFEEAFEAVVESFPNHELAVRRLMKLDDAFHEICIDFAEARAALARMSSTLDQEQEGQKSEWEEITGRLRADVGHMLHVYEASLQKDRG